MYACARVYSANNKEQVHDKVVELAKEILKKAYDEIDSLAKMVRSAHIANDFAEQN